MTEGRDNDKCLPHPDADGGGLIGMLQREKAAGRIQHFRVELHPTVQQLLITIVPRAYDEYVDVQLGLPGPVPDPEAEDT